MVRVDMRDVGDLEGVEVDMLGEEGSALPIEMTITAREADMVGIGAMVGDMSIEEATEAMDLTEVTVAIEGEEVGTARQRHMASP